MRASPRCLDLIAEFEQFRPTAYLPTKDDVWTIGYGHTRGVKEGDTCTRDAALELLRDDVQEAEDAVSELVTVDLTQSQFDALVSLVFNIGGGAFEESTLRRKLNDGQYEAAADEFPKWCRQKGKKLRGLERRRAAEKELFEGESA